MGDIMNFEKLDKFFEDLKSKDIPGMSIAVSKNGKVVYKNIFGLKSDGETPIKSSDPFFMYSTTKVVTAVAAMQLVERGLLELDAPASKYIPEFKNVYIGEERVPAKNTITVRELLSMTSGISYSVQKENIKKAIENKSLSTLDVVKAIAEDYIEFEPGTQYLYGLGLDVIGGIIEVVSGKKYGDYVYENIFKPLNMNDCTYHLSDDLLENMWPQYRYIDKEDVIKPEPLENGYIFSDNYESGGAGLIGTADDYIKLVMALANYGVSNDGYKLLSKESIDIMRKDVLGNDIKGFWKTGYGYGLGVRTLVDKSSSKSPLGEFGWDSAGCAYALVDVDNNIGIYIGCHILGWGPGYDNHNVIRDIVYDCLEN